MIVTGQNVIDAFRERLISKAEARMVLGFPHDEIHETRRADARTWSHLWNDWQDAEVVKAGGTTSPVRSPTDTRPVKNQGGPVKGAGDHHFDATQSPEHIVPKDIAAGVAIDREPRGASATFEKPFTITRGTKLGKWNISDIRWNGVEFTGATARVTIQPDNDSEPKIGWAKVENMDDFEICKVDLEAAIVQVCIQDATAAAHEAAEANRKENIRRAAHEAGKTAAEHNKAVADAEKGKS